MPNSHDMANLPYQIYAQAFYSHEQLHLDFPSTETSKHRYHLSWQKLDGTFSLYLPWWHTFLQRILWEQKLSYWVSLDLGVNFDLNMCHYTWQMHRRLPWLECINNKGIYIRFLKGIKNWYLKFDWFTFNLWYFWHSITNIKHFAISTSV